LRHSSLSGTAGHFGVRGIRERAALVGIGLTIESTESVGTEVRLSIPQTLAWCSENPRRKITLLGRLSGWIKT